MIDEKIALRLLRALKLTVPRLPHQSGSRQEVTEDHPSHATGVCPRCRITALIAEAEAPATVSQEWAHEQILRFEGLMGFPKMKPGLEDRVKALTTAPDTDLAGKVMDKLVEFSATGDGCPTAADIKSAIREEWDRRDGEIKAHPFCLDCGGNGYYGKLCHCQIRRKPEEIEALWKAHMSEERA